jgi:hypothetical protein
MSAIKSLIILLLMLCASIVTGCIHAADGAIDKQCSSLVTTFFRLPMKEQIAQFDKRDLKDQYTLLICGNQAIHPPALYLTHHLAKRGQIAAVFLKGELSAAKDDLTIRDIVMVFTEMSRQHTYDVAGDTALLAAIDSRVRTMKDSEWKSFVTQRAAEIRSNH